MRIQWEVDDGYVGKSAPQYTIIYDEDLEGMTPEEIHEEIEEAVHEDFRQKISYHIKRVDGKTEW